MRTSPVRGSYTTAPSLPSGVRGESVSHSLVRRFQEKEASVYTTIGGSKESTTDMVR